MTGWQYGVNLEATSEGGQPGAPNYGPNYAAQPFPMEVLNGCEHWKTNRRPSQSDVDVSPWLVRRYTNISVTDVQLNNGLQRGIGRGKIMHHIGEGYLYGVMPIIPGQTRDNVAGFHRRGPSPFNVQDVWDSGPGAQPLHPGGPGKIAAPRFINPMSG